MKETITDARRFTLPKTAKNVLIIVLCLLAFDVLVAGLGASYLSENIGAFLGKSRTVILSDLLFLEGAVVFAVGILITVGGVAQKPFYKQSTETTVNAEQTSEKWINLGVLMIIIGAILIGLSITFNTLLY